MGKPIKVLNNRDELLRMVDEQAKKGENYHALYRDNVNALITDFELSIMDIVAQKRIIAAAIWRNNNVGILRNNSRRAAWLKGFIMKLCNIKSPKTIKAIIKSVTLIENER